MTVSTVNSTMLYCPKCQQTYEDAAQRFCLSDGGRLVSVDADKLAGQSGVFTTILKRKTETENDKFASAPRFSKADRTKFTRPIFQSPLVNKVFRDAPEIDEDFQPRVESEPIVFEPVSPIVELSVAPRVEVSFDSEKTASTDLFVQPDVEEEIETTRGEIAVDAAIPAPLPIPSAKETELTKSAARVLPPLPDEDDLEFTGVKTTNDLAWQKRSPEMPNQATPRRNWLLIAAAAILLIGLIGVWSYFLNRQAETIVAPIQTENVNSTEESTENQSPLETTLKPAPPAEEIEAPPLPRAIAQPPNTIYFENNKESLSGDAVKNFLGFSLYYPVDWKLNESKNNFLDVSKNGENNLPLEQLLVSNYNSKGTFKADKPTFYKLVEKSNGDLKKALQGNYTLLSQGETQFQNGRWMAYEVKFKSSGVTGRGGKITLWGRRLWIPVQRPGMKNGYVITLLATSLSKEINSVNEIGEKGELKSILETFEPNQNF